MRTPLYDEHVKLGAKMTEFAGWEMPLQYAGIAHEVQVVRTKVGLFDISHMGEFVVVGPGALDLVQYVTTNDARKLTIGAAQYSLLCNKSGGIIDDLIVYRTGFEEYLLIVNAANTKTDFEWISSRNAFGATLADISDNTALIAVQGPNAAAMMGGMQPAGFPDLGRFHITSGRIGPFECHIARTGYTGEDGFEIACVAKDAAELWQHLKTVAVLYGGEAAGLGARDVLRLEAAYPLHGHEITPETTPVAAKLMRAVKSDKAEFIGRDAILRAKEKGEKRVLAGIEAVDRCIPRHGSEVTKDGAVVGVVTSGTFSPTLGKAIALAYIDRQCADIGTEVSVVTGGRTCACRVVQTPFYKRP
jgi:aminomethyltransferase